MREKIIEQKFRAAVRAVGGVAVKFVSPGLDGMPDRAGPVGASPWWEDGICGGQGYRKETPPAPAGKTPDAAAVRFPGVCTG